MLGRELIIWEEDGLLFLSGELPDGLPAEFLGFFVAETKDGKSCFQTDDKDIQSLFRLINAVPTVSSLHYIFDRLRGAPLPVATSDLMEQEMLTTAFIVTYGRLYASGQGTSGFARKDLPSNLKDAHDEIIRLRNKRYAHNDRDETVSSQISFTYTHQRCEIHPTSNLRFYVGGRDEWLDLCVFINEKLYDRLQKVMHRLKDKTGCDWVFPTGLLPDWVKS